MATFLTQLPTVAVLIVVIFSCVGLSVAGLLIMRRLVPHPVLREHNDVAGFIFAALGVIYAVILAFVVIAVWETFEENRDKVNEEGALVLNLHRELAPFDDPERTAIREALRTYVVRVIEDEWPRMEDGESSPLADDALQMVWTEVQALEPAGVSQEFWYKAAIDSLKDLTALRSVRLDEAEENLPSVMLVLLGAGAAITVAYTYLYGVRNLYGQVAMVSALAGTIAIALALVILLDSPFKGDTIIGTGAFEEALKALDRQS